MAIILPGFSEHGNSPTVSLDVELPNANGSPLYCSLVKFAILEKKGGADGADDSRASADAAHQVMATFRKTEKEVVMVVDRSGIHRAHTIKTTLDHYHGKFRFHFLPAHCGHHLNPIEGFWRVMKDAIGAGRCCERSAAALQAHPPSAHGTSRTANI